MDIITASHGEVNDTTCDREEEYDTRAQLSWFMHKCKK